MNRKSVSSDVWTLVDLIRTRQLPFLAAAIAYYAFLSVVPLLIVGVTVATAAAGQTLAAELLESLDAFLTPEAADLIEETLVTGTGRGGVTAVGLLVLLWGSIRVFRGLDIAFSQIYGVAEPKPLLAQVRDALIVLFGIGLAFGGTVALSAVLSLVDLPFAGATGTIGLVVVLAVVFLPMYYFFAGPGVSFRDALPGAVFASLGWTALGAGFGLYAANAGSLQLYGVLGGVLLLLMWFYFGGLILLLGAAINVVLGRSVEYRQLQQEGLRRNMQRASMTDDSGPTDGADDRESSRDEEFTGADQNGHQTDVSEQDSAVGAGDKTAEAVDETSDGGAEDADEEAADEGTEETDREPTGRQDPDVSARLTQEDIDDLRRELDEMEERLDDQTVHRDEIESDLKQYVRSRIRRGHATGWGPYLVLLYGTVMTLGAFVFLGGGWAVLAMLVIWLSTLGLYVLMILVGLTIKGVGLPFRLIDKLRNLR